MVMKRLRIEPGPGQESVWDYPRPPVLEPVTDQVRIVFAGECIVAGNGAYRVLETSHPPVYYIPPSEVRGDILMLEKHTSGCEFKGIANYWSLDVNETRSANAAWSYSNPTAAFQPIKDYLAFYASRVDACWVGDKRVQSQAGDFYGGWITDDIVGPFKGEPGTWGW